MGLDMMLYRCGKPCLTDGDFISYEKKYSLEQAGVNFYSPENYLHFCKTMKDCSVQIFTDDLFYDYTMIAIKLCEENKIEYFQEIEDSMYMSSSSSKEIVFTYNKYKTSIPTEDIECYYIHKRVELYAIAMNEVDYQRKGLNSKGWELMACENCEYTDDYDAVKAMVDEGGLSHTFLDNWREGQTVFHPWW